MKYARRFALTLAVLALLPLCGCAAAPEIVDIPMPTAVPTPIPTLPPTPAPAPAPTQKPTLKDRAAELIDAPLTRLINYEHQIPADYASADMVLVEGLDTEGVLSYSSDGLMGDREATLAFLEMIVAARAEGVEGYLLKSVYRTYGEQRRLWDNKVADVPGYGSDGAPVVTAYPGASEHQAGLAFDVSSVKHRKLNAAFAETEQCQWLYAHCTEFGFIVRYPEGSESVTGIMYEPWHFRYVGVELAAYLTDNGLILEQFYSGLY